MFILNNFSTDRGVAQKKNEECFELPEVAESRVLNISKKYGAQDEHSVQWIGKSFQASYLWNSQGGDLINKSP